MGVLTSDVLIARVYSVFKPHASTYLKTFEQLLAVIGRRYVCAPRPFVSSRAATLFAGNSTFRTSETHVLDFLEAEIEMHAPTCSFDLNIGIKLYDTKLNTKLNTKLDTKLDIKQ
jgi:hypothetical protein